MECKERKPKFEVLRSMWIQFSPEAREELEKEYVVIEIRDEDIHNGEHKY